MTSFSIIIETDRDLLPGEIAQQLKRIHSKIIECRVSGGIYASDTGEQIGEFFYAIDDGELMDDEEEEEEGEYGALVSG